MNKQFILLILQFICFLTSYAQIGLTVETPVNVDNAISKLSGEGVVISNITSDCNAEAFGEFDDVLGEIGLDKGILMTNGSAKEVATINNGNASTDYELSSSDPDLTNSLNNASIFNVNLNDACKIEFDIIPAKTGLSFRYVFGSDEYLEYVGSGVEDAFGFYVTGEFKQGQGVETRNLATVPNTNEVVSIETINDKKNADFYIDNQSLKNIPGDKFFEYDGYTVPLIAKTSVIPCETYRIKLIIADVGDGIIDSGVLIEAGSFVSVSEPLVEIKYEHDHFEHLIEECNNGELIFKRPEYLNTSTDLTVNYLVKGIAENGVDYQKIPNSIVIPKGQETFSVPLITIKDNIKEELENIQIDVLNTCPKFPIAYSLTVPLREDFDYSIQDAEICWGDEVQLNPNAINRDSLIWGFTNSLSCLNCNSPIANNLQTEIFQVRIIDKPSLCQIQKEVNIQVTKVEADFDFKRDENYTSLDIQFTNLSKNAQSYLWDFGDKTSSTIESPFHYFPFENLSSEQQKYTVQLIARSENPICSDTIEKEILIEEPLYIPNIITPNKDLKNDKFIVNGIIFNKWSFTVYNRWGKEVYFTEGYRNEWLPNDLKDGVYYFILENPNKDRTYKGWVEILH